MRGQYFRRFANLFTHFSSLFLIVLVTVFLVLLYSKIGSEVAKNISRVIYYFPSLLAFGFLIGTFLLKKSAYLQYGSFYTIFSFIILNAVLLVARDGNVSEETYKWLYLSVAIVNALAYAGIKTYLSVRKEVQKMQKQLKLL